MKFDGSIALAQRDNEVLISFTLDSVEAAAVVAAQLHDQIKQGVIEIDLGEKVPPS